MAIGRRRIKWIVGAVVVVVVLAVGGPFVFIHFIDGKSPAQLQLPVSPSATTVAGQSADASGGTTTSVDGTWNVGSGSVVGYRVGEVLIGQSTTAVGRTSKVWGSLTISGSAATTGSFTADMATVESDQSQRNAQFDSRIMNVSAYPTATFKLTGPIQLGTVPAAGQVKQYEATGTLNMHGVTRTIQFTLSAERSGASIYVLAEIPIKFSNWNIANPSVGGFVTTQSSGTLEVLLDLTKGAGNPVAVTGSSSGGAQGGGAPSGGGPGGGEPGGGGAPSGGGPGGPVTVPPTTVPSLTVPAN